MKGLHVNSLVKIKEIKTWLNVQSVEKRFNLRKLGRWPVLANQINTNRLL